MLPVDGGFFGEILPLYFRYMRRSRIVLMVGILVTASGFGWYYAKNHVSPHVEASYAPGAFTVGQEGNTYAFDSTSNVFIGSFTLPAPLNDTLTIDGATNIVAAKNVLTSFPSTVKMYDVNNSDAFDASEGIITSSDTILSTNDVVLTSAMNALQTPATGESVNLLVYFDQGATSGSYDTNEDIYRQVYSGSSGVITDGSTAVRTFENTLAFFDLDADSTLDFASISTYDTETVLRDADADSKPSAGDSILASGYAGVGGLSTSSSVCFDGSVVNDTEYDLGEKVWFDVGGDCSSFLSGTDFLLLGAGAPSGTSTEFGTEQEIAYFDTDVSGTYTCSRTGTCEPLFYSGVDGTNVGTGAQTNTANVFLTLLQMALTVFARRV